MDAKSLALLELPKVLERLSVFASFSAGVDLCRSLRPTDDVEAARAWQEMTTEARKLLSTKTDVPLGGSRDVREAAGLAARRGRLALFRLRCLDRFDPGLEPADETHK